MNTQLDLFQESYVKGVFKQEIFYNEETGYGVFILKVTDASEEVEEEEITVVGNMLRPYQEEVYCCYGEWRNHPKFGRQWYAHRVQKEIPRSRDAIIRYLSSGLFSGVGQKTAEKIVDFLGTEALDKIANDPRCLEEIKGISAAKARKIAEQLHDHQGLEQALVYLYQFGIGPALALRIVQTYKHETISILKENPYRMIEEIDGIGFRRADEIAKAQGLSEDAPERFQAALLYVIKEASLSRGHVYVTWEQLNEAVNDLLGEEAVRWFPEEKRTLYIEHLLDDDRLILEDGRYYLPSLYYAEYGLAMRVKQLLEEPFEPDYSVADIYGKIGEIEEELSVSYAEKQRDALITAMSSSLMILTGGPGTGKTTVIQGICQLFSRLNEISINPEDYKGTEKPFPIRLVAPTGRAAKRMSETTGLPAMTIHRLLGWKGEFFEHHADHPIEGSLLIVDEVSMLDIWLANSLFRAIPKGMQVILVGDQEQLPSVGPGQVLHHLLQVKEIPRAELTEIFRQQEGSSIIELAHAVKNGEVPDDLLLPRPDRRFFSCKKEQALSVIVQTVVNAVKKGYTLFDIQVLAPIYKGPVGVNRINEEIQAVLNPPGPQKKEIAWGDTVFRLGDKVLQLVNHTEHPVYNGDMGIITSIDETASGDQPVLWVRYDRLEVPYKKTQLGQISLAYACSVHKAQGSEFPIVVFPVLFAFRRMLERNLIYTGITRSKSYLIMCGEKEALVEGLKNQRGEERNSRLQDLIEEDW
ncbi:ATP-dependent RecD-like DNA helicase [Thermoactinomyces vulgaris]|jgi:exodeoxyribonuclease V alpha subunit|uniref:ATP-dependent RecD2 DNA helicase n=1 Tax=Thermoactinomyces vulgaris TaxID=2026 RepID=A0ABS0QHR7_THEVU|nr:ATP-dependent RecD-like DNA helicase [Thermoactinomyces vulgaris]MBA4550737.1 ATP-dependent RecD-like DNA helicase [Thermoactinomyces vulgaris]MBA4596204.1 ATP-dependent RecD-like DNA helicase [Thermoactinomyces vulgaris]MBH8588513.1 ATP-dependent RecD-like DNA helicase [Thermoactinomyces vulgaris]RMB02238.1 exodeoxyribonuclease V alpha subunit [Thermoactinomyces vulgaris]